MGAPGGEEGGEGIIVRDFSPGNPGIPMGCKNVNTAAKIAPFASFSFYTQKHECK